MGVLTDQVFNFSNFLLQSGNQKILTCFNVSGFGFFLTDSPFFTC